MKLASIFDDMLHNKLGHHLSSLLNVDFHAQRVEIL